MPREMKDSGIEWIGEIPSHWKLPKVKQLFQIGRGRVIAVTELTEEGLYPVFSSQTKNNGCLGYIDTYDFDRDQLTWTTDGANAGTVFLRTGKHNCTNVCGTLLPYSNAHNLKYLKFALEYIAIYHKRADINGYKIMNNEMADIVITLPSKQEQDDIADFLDKKCTEIDAVIEQTKATIEEYKKLKQSIITEAVTKGIRGDRPMKDSGIEWIGEIPMDWEKDKVFRMFRIIGSGTTPKSNDDTNFDGNINWIQSGDINGRIITSCKNQISDRTLSEYSALKVYASPFIIIAMYGASVGNIAVSKIDGCVNQACCVLSQSNVNFQFAFYALKAAKDYLITKAVGGGQPNISQDTLKQLWFAIPPLTEQQEIADYLDQKCAEIDSLIEKKTALLEEMEALKKSIIFEYVTSKKEVAI